MSTEHDFDFLHGSWDVEHRSLRRRLSGCDDWDEFTGTVTCWPTLGGAGTADDNWLDHPSGSYGAIAMRAFDRSSASWSIWWLDQRAPRHLDPPVVGCFENGVGTFATADVFEGRPIVVRFTWSRTDTDRPLWEQAFSDDDGETWETNWSMWFSRRE